MNLGRDTLGSPGVGKDGNNDTANVGMDGPIVAAVNSCIRKWASALGIYWMEQVTFTSGKNMYGLTANYIDDGTAAKPWKVYSVRADSGTVYGYERVAKPSEIGTATESPRLMFDVVGSQIWLSRGVQGDLVRIYGPLAGLVMTDGADTTNVPDQDRNAICDCATAIAGKRIGFPEAQDYWNYYRQHIIDRGGVAPPNGIPSQ